MRQSTIGLSPTPPDHLSTSSKELFSALIPRFRDVARRELLIAGLTALDRADAARACIDADGLLQKPRKGRISRPHPAARIEAQARADYLRVWHRLGLDRAPQPRRVLVGTGTLAAEERARENASDK